MKATLLVLSIVVGCVVAQGLIEYAGTSAATGNQWYPPVVNSGVCSPISDPSPYVAFNVTFNTPGVREVALLAENSFKSDVLVYVYSTLNVSDPCSGLVVLGNLEKQFSSAGGPVIDDFIRFEAASYIFVVTGDDGASGLFALNIFPSTATGQVTINSPTWLPLYRYSAEDEICYTESSVAPYGTYTWFQPSSGFYDVYALFANTTVAKGDFDTYLAVYEGPVPSPTGLAFDPCNVTALGGSVPYFATYSSGSKGVFYPYAYLSANTTYTAVFSSDGDTAYWGVQIIPTRIRFYQNTTTFTQPSRNTYPCEESTSYTGAGYDTTLFTATHNTYLIDTGYPPSPFHYIDTYSFLYQGNNTGNPPSTCGYPLISDGDTGDITPVFANTVEGYLYTVVVSTYSGSLPDPDGGYAYTLYLFTGDDIPVINTTTTGLSTTTGDPSYSTTSAAATTSAYSYATSAIADTTTSAAYTSTTSTASTTGAATTSAASSNAATVASTSGASTTSGAATTSAASTTGVATSAASTTSGAATTSAASTAAATTAATAASTTSSTAGATTSAASTTSVSTTSVASTTGTKSTTGIVTGNATTTSKATTGAVTTGGGVTTGNATTSKTTGTTSNSTTTTGGVTGGVTTGNATTTNKATTGLSTGNATTTNKATTGSAAFTTSSTSTTNSAALVVASMSAVVVVLAFLA